MTTPWDTRDTLLSVCRWVGEAADPTAEGWFSRFALTQADTALASSLRLAWAMQISAPYSFLLSSNFGRLGVAMDLRSMIANVQAEPKVSVAIGYFVTR